MKVMLFAAVLFVAARGAQAIPFEFKSYSFANYGSPFSLILNTRQDMFDAIVGLERIHLFGGEFLGFLDELYEPGPTSVSDERDVDSRQHVAYSAAAVYRPPLQLTTEAPGIGAKASASNTAGTGTSTTIGESWVYLKDTVRVESGSNLDFLTRSYSVTMSLDGEVNTIGDAIVQVGQAIMITLDNGHAFVQAEMQNFQARDEGRVTTFKFGPGAPNGAPLLLSNRGPSPIDILEEDVRSMTVETLLYVRAQTGGLARGPGKASAEFSNTLRVTNIQLFDQNGQVIPGLRVVGSSGAVYPYNVVSAPAAPVPGPATWALVGLGMVGLSVARARRVGNASKGT